MSHQLWGAAEQLLLRDGFHIAGWRVSGAELQRPPCAAAGMVAPNPCRHKMQGRLHSCKSSAERDPHTLLLR